MQLSDDGSADEVEQTPATLPALMGADATARRMSPHVQRLLTGSRSRLGAIGAQRTLLDEMETSGDGTPPGGSTIPPGRDHGATDTTGYVQSAVENIEQQATMQKMREQEQLIQRLMLKLEETQVAVTQLQNSPGRMAADEEVSFKTTSSTMAMQEQMRAQQELIQMLAVNMAESTQLQRESVELNKQQYAGSKVRKDTDKSFDTLEADFETLGINDKGQGVRDARKWGNSLRKQFGSLFKNKLLKSKLAKKAINEISGMPESVPKDQRINFALRWTSANQSNIVKAEYAKVRPSADAHAEWLIACRSDPAHKDRVAEPPEPDYTRAFETFLTKLAAIKPQQMAKDHKLCFPSFHDTKLRWKKGDSFEKHWERILERANDASEILRDLYRTECSTKGIAYDVDDETFFVGPFSELEGKRGLIKNVISALPNDVLDYITITADKWPKNDNEWTYEHFAPVIDAYLASDVYKGARNGNGEKQIKALQQQVNALQREPDAKRDQGGRPPRSQGKAAWVWYRGDDYDHFRKTSYHILNGSAVPGKDKSTHPENGCDNCGCHGHHKNNCPDANPSGTKVLVPCNIDDRKRVFGPNFGTPPKGAGTAGNSQRGPRAAKVQKVTEIPDDVRDQLSALKAQNDQLVAAMKDCSEVCDVKFMAMIRATSGSKRQALYIKLDSNVWVMIDSGAEVYAMLGLEAHRDLCEKAWFRGIGPKNPKVKFASISGDGLGYVGDTGGHGYFNGRAIPIHTASVCRHIPKNTILLGNIFMQETGSAVDWGKREIIIRSTSGMADLVIPFAPPNEAGEVTWCRGLQMTTEIEGEPYPYTDSAGDSTPTSMVSNVKVLRATFAQFWNTWHSGNPTLEQHMEMEMNMVDPEVGSAYRGKIFKLYCVATGEKLFDDVSDRNSIFEESYARKAKEGGQIVAAMFPDVKEDDTPVMVSSTKVSEDGQCSDDGEVCTKGAEKDKDMEQKPDAVESNSSVGSVFKHWSSAFMTMVTMAVMATTSATQTVLENAVPLGLVAGVMTTGLQEPVDNGLWDAQHLMQEDLMPNFNYEDIFFGPTKSHHYSYEIGQVTTGATNVIEKRYRYNPHDAAKDNRLSPIAEQVFTIPTKPDVNDGGAEQHIANVRRWRLENRHVTDEYESRPDNWRSDKYSSVLKWTNDDSNINLVTQAFNTPKEEEEDSTAGDQMRARFPILARMHDRGIKYADANAEEYTLNAVRGAGVDENKSLWDQLDCDNSEWCKKNALKVKAMLLQHKEVFQCDGKQRPFVDQDGKVVEIPIHLTDDAPVAQRAWRLSPEKLAVLDQYLDELLEQGVIEPTKYSPYSAVTVLVPKKGQFDKDGNQRLRVTTDYRRLNKKTRKLAYNGKTVQEMFDMVDGATMFSTYDVSSAFYNLLLRQDAREKTAFSTPHRGLFQYLRLPMGLSISPGILAGEYEEMFRIPVTINGVRHEQALGSVVGIYCDDVIGFSNEEDHMAVNKFILSTLAKHNVNLRADKSFIGRREVEYLGMIISGDGISISPAKTKAVWDAKRPASAEDTRRFLGMASYLRSFVPDFAANSKNMTGNLAKGATWIWDDRHEREYQYILSAICSDNCLAPFSWGKESILRTDSSAAGYGAVLCQMHGKIRRPVAFISRQLNDTEAQRPGRDLEAGCLTWAVQKFRNYLIHRPFVVHGDCSNLQWIHKYDGSNRRLYNYSLILSQYQMRFVYKKGSSMADCDWLSRSALHQYDDDQDTDNPDFNMPEVGSDLGATPVSEGRIAAMRQRARQPREGARNTYHCCNKGKTGRNKCPSICPQFWLAPDNKLYCTSCLPTQWEKRARSISVSDWDRHSLCSEDYRHRDHWHRLGWNKSDHNTDFDCSNSCPCCRAQQGEFFNACPVCNEDMYGDCRPLWDLDEAMKDRATGLLKRTKKFNSSNSTRGTGRAAPKLAASKKFDADQLAQSRKAQKMMAVKRQSLEPQRRSKKPAWIKKATKTKTPTRIFSDGGADVQDPVTAYKVISVGAGIGTDSMAVADFDHMKVVAACEEDALTAALAKERTGLPMYDSMGALILDINNHTVPQPDVLSFTGSLGHKEGRVSLLNLVDETLPTVILAESTDQLTKDHRSDEDHRGAVRDIQASNIALESALHKKGYVVESATMNASEHGGYVAEPHYVLVAHRTNAYFRWPSEKTKFPGCTEVLQHAHTVDPRTRRKGHQSIETKPAGNFSPWKAGFIKGGGEYRGVYDPANPLPSIRPYYNKHTREHGGQYIVDCEGTRLLTQTEEMRLLGFSEDTINQLQDQVPSVQQHCVGTASCVTMKSALFASVQTLLDASQTTPGLQMPTDRKVAGILAHAVMPSLHEIKLAQQKDKDIRQLLQYVTASDKQKKELESGLPTKYKRHAQFMHLNDGALFFRDIFNDEWLTDAVVLPPNLIEAAMIAFHDSGYGGHQGFNKTKVAMMERVWFPHMSKRIAEHIDNCEACRRSKAIRRKHAGKSCSSLYMEAFEVCAIDLQGPYLKSSDGNQYILHVIDLFTNWNVTIAIPNKEAATVAKAFHDSVIIGGPMCTPVALISDRGTEFLNGLYRELTEQFNIKHLKTTALHPTGNAGCERQHRTYNAILRTMLHKYGKQFDEALPYATYAINTSAIEGTRVSPYEMLYGRKPKDPNTVAATDHPAWTAKKTSMSPAEHIKMLRERMAEAQVNVQLSRLQVARKNQAQMAKMNYEKKMQVGDLVLRWTGNTKRGLYGKLAYTTVGPFEIVSLHKHNTDIYELRHLASPDKGTSMHHIRELCPYITKEAHEQQKPHFAVNQPISKLDPQVGDYLLLPNGSRDFVTKVMELDHGLAQVQYMNKKDPGKGPIAPYTGLRLAWQRKKPSNNPFEPSATDEEEELYVDRLSPAQVAAGWKPFEEVLSLDEFYQRVISPKDLKKSANGYTLNRAKRAIVTKAKPIHTR